MTIDKSIGKRLFLFMTTIDVSQIVFAQQLGISRGYLNEVLNGRKGIGSNILVNAAKVYKNLNIRWLITGEGEMYEPAIGHTYMPGSVGGVAEPGPEYGKIKNIEMVLSDHERRLLDLEGKK